MELKVFSACVVKVTHAFDHVFLEVTVVTIWIDLYENLSDLHVLPTFLNAITCVFVKFTSMLHSSQNFPSGVIFFWSSNTLSCNKIISSAYIYKKT